MTSDRVLVGASGTALAVTVGATGSLLKALGAAVAPLVAAGEKEAEDRKKTVAELRHRPFWALHEMVDELRRRA